MMSIVENFHFLRPGWLLALPVFGYLLALLFRHHGVKHSWQGVVDTHLLPHLTRKIVGGGSRLPLVLLGIVWFVAIVALAGPSWSRLPQPVFRTESVMLLLLDVSRSMDAEDIRPSRLTRAKHKILDLLAQRQEGQVGLIAYAAQPYVVAPLTDDAHTIASMVPVLSSDIMPSQGSHLLPALEEARKLLQQSGVPYADIVVVADDVDDPKAVDLAAQFYKQGYRVSVLAVATPQGAPIPARGGGFVKDASGAIVVPKLSDSLSQVAAAGGGVYTELSVDDGDLLRIRGLRALHSAEQQESAWQQTSDQWQEAGIWLLIPVVMLALLGFRRGWLLTPLLVPVLLLPAQPAQAGLWQDLWANDNQRAVQALDAGEREKAAALFRDPAWKAAAYYRAGEYNQALEHLSGLDTADAHYNRGNALAHMGKIDEAITAYEQALARDANHQDAQANKEVLEALKQAQQQDQQQQQSQQNQQQDGQQQNSQQQSSQQGQQGQQGQNQDAAQQSGADGRDGQASKQPPSGGETQAQDKTQGGQQQAQEQGADDQQPADSRAQADGQDPESNRQDPAAQQAQVDATKTEQGQQQKLPTDQESVEKVQAVEQWLGRIPDDPGGLLREKFRRQYMRREAKDKASDSGEQW